MKESEERAEMERRRAEERAREEEKRRREDEIRERLKLKRFMEMQQEEMQRQMNEESNAGAVGMQNKRLKEETKGETKAEIEIGKDYNYHQQMMD